MQPQQGQDGKWYIQNNGQWQEVAAPQQNYGPPAQQGYGSPAQQGYGPPAQQGYGPPAQQGYGPPAQQGLPHHDMMRTPGGHASHQGNPFVSLGEADPSGGQRLPYFLVGNYQLEIVRLKMQESRKGKLQLIIESLILASDNPERPAGMKCSAFIDLSNADTRDQHVKRLICAVQGVNHEDPRWKGPLSSDGRTWQQVAWEGVDESNPWAGRKIGCEVTIIDLKNGDEWTLHSWVAYDKVHLVQRPSAAVPQLADVYMRPGTQGGPPGFAPQGAPPGFAPQGMPPSGPPGGFAPQGMPPQGGGAPPGFAPQGAPPGFTPQGAPPGFAPQGAPQGGPPGFQPQGPGFQPQGPGPQQPRPGFQGGAFPPHGS